MMTMISNFLFIAITTATLLSTAHAVQLPQQQQQQELLEGMVARHHPRSSYSNRKTRHLLHKLSQQQQEEQSHQDQARRIFDMAMTARDASNSVIHPSIINNNSNRRRQLQNDTDAGTDMECSIAAVAAETCSLADYCAELNLMNDNTTTTCDGSIFALWSVTTQSAEACIYASMGIFEPLPFDEDLYQEGIDVCFTVVAVLNYFQSVPEGFERGFYFDRPPFQGVFKEYFRLEPCDEPAYDGQIVAGFCEVCTSAEINDELCNGCSECTAETDLGSRTIDCSNIAPELINTCATADDDLIGPVVNYLGGLCTFSEAMAGECPVEEYCTLLAESDIAVDSVVCEGDVTGEWSLAILYKELCYYEPENPNFPGSPFYDEEFFDPAQGHYCEQSSAIFPFVGDTPSVGDYTIVVTRPESLTGSLRVVVDLVSCDEPDFEDWGDGVCEVDCGEFSLNGNACTSGCLECPNGEFIHTCTDLDETLVEPCDSFEGVPEDFRTYFAEVNAATSNLPTLVPDTQLPDMENVTMTPGSATNGTMAPTMMNATMGPTSSVAPTVVNATMEPTTVNVTMEPTSEPTMENVTVAPNATEVPDLNMTLAPNMTMPPNVTETPMSEAPSRSPSTPIPVPTMEPTMGATAPLEPTSASAFVCASACSGLMAASLIMLVMVIA